MAYAQLNGQITHLNQVVPKISAPKNLASPKTDNFLVLTQPWRALVLDAVALISKLPPAMRLKDPFSYKHKSCFIFVAFLIDGCILPKEQGSKDPNHLVQLPKTTAPHPNPGSSPRLTHSPETSGAGTIAEPFRAPRWTDSAPTAAWLGFLRVGKSPPF